MTWEKQSAPEEGLEVRGALTDTTRRGALTSTTQRGALTTYDPTLWTTLPKSTV